MDNVTHCLESSKLSMLDNIYPNHRCVPGHAGGICHTLGERSLD